jgi:glycine/D-amino acid oxidase-like deaminating enzyme
MFDVDTNNGHDTAYYLQRGFRVVAIEADPTLAAGAERCASAVAAPTLAVVPDA